MDPKTKALQFALEIVRDELREGYEGHGGIMFSLEPILRDGLGEPADPDCCDEMNPKSPQARRALAECLGRTYIMLLAAGWVDDAFVAQVKAARDFARNQEAEGVKP